MIKNKNNDVERRETMEIQINEERMNEETIVEHAKCNDRTGILLLKTGFHSTLNP